MDEFQLYLFYPPHSPLATAKESFPGSLPPTNGPGPSTVSSATIDSTLIHKNKLVGIIRAYASCEVCSFLSTSLNCDARELFNRVSTTTGRRLIDNNIIVAHLFHCITSFSKRPPDR
jgi:hypothetical protein